MFNLQSIVRQNIQSLLPYSSARDEFKGRSGVFLDANENPFGTLNRYPDPYQTDLKSKIAALKEVDTQQIFIGNGSDEVIDLVFRIFCQPREDKALTFSPTYGMYDVSAAINEVSLTKLPLTENFQIDLDAVVPLLKDPQLKLVFICSPNNPTGNLFSKKTVETLLKRFNGIVVIDEAYIDFSPTESWVSMLNEFPNLIVCQTFSKAWGLAAARVGMAFASEEIITLLNKVKPPYNVSELNQQAAIEALENKAQFLSNLKQIREEKELLQKNLQELDIVLKIYPSKANFLLVKVSNATKIYTELVQQKIITRNRNSLIANCIRISVGTPSENKKLLTALKNIKS